MSGSEIKISNAFFRLLNDHSMKDINVSMLCRDAGVGRATFYRHYRDTIDIVNRFYESVVSDAIENTDTAIMVFERRRQFGDRLFMKIGENRGRFLLLHRNGMTHSIMFTIEKRLKIDGPEYDLKRLVMNYYLGGTFTLINLLLESGMRGKEMFDETLRKIRVIINDPTTAEMEILKK